MAEEIRRSHRQKLTVGTVRKLTKRESEVLDALRRAGDEGGIELSGRFNRMRSKKSVVDTLYNALREGNLLEKAREILVDGSEEGGEREEEPDVDLKRVCWCWLEKR
ncbi:hypothetical protein [Thermogymnomonas acidicola]|uniref:hypothetical protein n=1 Tax=Thermogymnomonas acidicola TaxID=399579 RepID=UPI0013969F28|nr:hypothetical protein [Thermogymnomonas acidicola]